MLVRLLARRLLFLVLVLFGLSLITFSLSHLVPANPARLIAGPRASAATVEKIRKQKGYDQPVMVQYVRYVKGVMRLDFGDSTATRRPVKDDLKRYLPATLELGLYAFMLSTLVGVPLGVISAVRRNSWIDHLSRFISISGLALPVFWLALMAQFLFLGSSTGCPTVNAFPWGLTHLERSRRSTPSTPC